jgi:hygromycin-B 7''-O-kinase
MPDVETLEIYRDIYHRDDLWRPIIEVICDRYVYLEPPYQRVPDGTHIVYFAGHQYVVKLFVPLFDQDFIAEKLVADHLSGQLDIDIPKIVACGEIGGWNYIVMSRIPGIPINAVWKNLTQKNRLSVARDIGRLISRIRTISTKSLETITIDWSDFLRKQKLEISKHFESRPDLKWDPGTEITNFIVSISSLLNKKFDPVLLLSDITLEHVFVQEKSGNWKMTGYLDFGDAMVGHPDYEIIAPGLEFAAGNPELLQTLLLAAGYHSDELDESLVHRLMAYTLLHRYVELNDVLSLIPRAKNAPSLQELSRIIWPITDH